MLTPKAKMRINLAVKDYISMFPDEYKATLRVIEEQKQNLENEMAEVKSTHAIKRMLSTIPEKLFQMIQKKLDDKKEVLEFSTMESQRWFLKEHPEFRVTHTL